MKKHDKDKEPTKPVTDGNPNGESVGVHIEWKPSGRSGSGTIIIALPGGPFTDSVKIVNESARAKLLAKLERCATSEVVADLREQLEQIAATAAEQMPSGDEGGNDKDANKLIELVLEDEQIELFHAPGDSDCGYITVVIDGKQETFFIGSMSFKAWLSRRFFEAYRSAAGGQAMTDACQVLTGHALHVGPQVKVETRVAFCGDGIALDIGDAERNVVLITKTGWEVQPGSEVPVRFIRRNGSLPLPFPVKGGSVDLLRRYVNVPDDDSWVLVVGFLVASLFPRGPFPVLVISGEQGSAKSTLARMLQRLIDANKAELRRPPKNEEDLIIAASNTWLLAYDNLSGIRPELSDAICTLATGGGFAARRFFTNGEEVIFQAQRPVMLNGIDDLTRRADLLDRSVVLRLESIHEARRQPEDVLWAGFEQVAPKVLGALLDALVGVLQRRELIHLDTSPRMADFAKTVCAAEASLGWEPRTFLSAYERNRDLARSLAIEESAIAREILRLMANVPLWEGTATDLQVALVRSSSAAQYGTLRSIPSPEAIGKELRRVAPSLRHVGVEVQVDDRLPHPDRSRIVRLARTARWKNWGNRSADGGGPAPGTSAEASGSVSRPWNGWNGWNGSSQNPDVGEDAATDDAQPTRGRAGDRSQTRREVGTREDEAGELDPEPELPSGEAMGLAEVGASFKGPGTPSGPARVLVVGAEKQQGQGQDDPLRESAVAGGPVDYRSNCSNRSSEAGGEPASAPGRSCYACGGSQRWRLRDAGDGRPGDWMCSTCRAPVIGEDRIERIDAAGGAA